MGFASVPFLFRELSRYYIFIMAGGISECEYARGPPLQSPSRLRYCPLF